MQFMKIFFFGAVAAAALLAATAVMAADDLSSCTPGDADGIGDNVWEFKVSAGPCPIQCGAPVGTGNTFCDDPGPCTGIEYEVVGSAAQVTVLASSDLDVVAQSGSQTWAPCEGDSVVDLGLNSCHEQAVRLDDNGSTQFPYLVVQGSKAAGVTTIGAHKGKNIGSCRITGIGSEEAPNACVASCGNFDPNQQILRIEVVKFEDCSVEFQYDLITGEVVSAKLTQESIALGCESPNPDFDPNDGTINPAPVGALEVTLDGTPLGSVTYGDGYWSSGEFSCTTRIIGGVRYTWGNPCPQ